MTIAIDFGTSNTVVARWNEVTQEAEVLSLPGISQDLGNNLSLIPSLVYVENAAYQKVIVGKQVSDRGLDLTTDSRFFRSFKRGIGTKVQGFLPELDGKQITFERIGELFLTQIITSLQEEDKTESLVLTVPVDSFEAYRHWLGDICQSLAVEQVQMLDEPTAAALGYGTIDENLLLVVDFGGGTVDLSLVKLDLKPGQNPGSRGFILKWGENFFGESSGQKPKTARVLAKAGQNLGGSDLDNWLVDYFVEKQGLTKSPLTTRLAERLKIQLSSQTEGSEVYFNDETLESYELALSRRSFETILKEKGFFQRLDELITQVLQQGKREGITTGDIDAVLLVGGTTQIPAIQAWIQKYFEPEKIKCDRPFTAIAAGALQVFSGVEVKDFLYHSYGIRYWNRKENRHSWHTLVQSGQPYPMNKPIELILSASVPNQPSIELIIGELGTDTGGTEVYFDGDRLVTRSIGAGEIAVQPLNDQEGARTVAKLSPLGNPGSDRIKLQFYVDKERFLRLTVEDLLTNETLLIEQAVVQLS